MNLFYLDSDPVLAALFHCNKHVVKMVVETAQLMSTAHRLLDGQEQQVKVNGRVKKVYLLPGETYDVEQRTYTEYGLPYGRVMAPTHVNHPQAVWVRSGRPQYDWAFYLFTALLLEYQRRYERVHASARFLTPLSSYPRNLPQATPWTDPPLTMPDQYKSADPVGSYRAFYAGEKVSFAKWPEGETPTWFQELTSST